MRGFDSDAVVSRFASRLLAAIIISIVFVAPARADQLSGTWSLTPTTGGNVDLILQRQTQTSFWTWRNKLAPSALEGLTENQIAAPSATVRFSLVHSSGNFICQGTLVNGKGSGTFVFVPSPTFTAALSQRGMTPRSFDEQFELAMAGVTLQYIDALRQAHYNPSVEDILRLLNDGVDLEYVEAVTHAGTAPNSIDGLIRLRDHDVSPELLAAMRSAGTPMTVDGAIRLADHGVSPSYIQGLHQLGYSPGVDELVRLADHDVTLGWIRQVQLQGMHPSVDDLIRMRDAGV